MLPMSVEPASMAKRGDGLFARLGRCLFHDLPSWNMRDIRKEDIEKRPLA